MTLDEYIDLNIKLIQLYRKNPSLPINRDGIKACMLFINDSLNSGKFDELDAQLALQALREHGLKERLIKFFYKFRLTLKRALKRLGQY